MARNVRKKLDILIGKRMAHRGLWNKDNPENSIGAYKRCIDKGIPIELDVHLLKDGTLVAFHDDDTFRMTGEKIILKDASYDDIKDLRLNNTKYGIPKFKEVLDLVSGKVLLDIEIKIDVKNFRICQELCKYLDKYEGDFVIKSFNPAYLLWFRLNRPNYVRGLLVSKLGRVKINNIFNYMLFNIWFNFLAKPDFIAFDYRNLPSRRLDKLRSSGVLVILYTLKEEYIVNYKYDGYVYEE